MDNWKCSWQQKCLSLSCWAELGTAGQSMWRYTTFEHLKDKFIPGISQSSMRAALMVSPAADGFQRSLLQPENRREAEQCYPCSFLSSPERDSQLYTAQRLSFWKGLLALSHSFPLQELGWETLCFLPRVWPGEALCTLVWLIIELNIVFIYFSLS